MITIFEDNKFVSLAENFDYVTAKANGKPMVFIPIFGPYNVGKSSTIKKITLDTNILESDGFLETRSGTNIYGPYPYNEIRKRFDMEDVEDGETQVFFFDTNPTGPYGKTSIFEEKSYIDQLVAPCIALSSVIIFMIRPNNSVHEIEVIRRIFQAIKSIRQDMRIIILVTNIPKYRPKQGKFEKYQKKLMKVFVPRFGEDFKTADFIPLPYEFNQSEYDEGFKIFVQHLMNHIEETRRDFVLDQQSASDIFKSITSKADDQLLTELAQHVIAEAKRAAEERLKLRKNKHLYVSIYLILCGLRRCLY
ncbi:hypothetical protein GPJ56_001521 [Histomonas meleagridis]|uniref:uncharacterized protein n=1 Tax=Histomonas meleagridis TaxID=135588 RepID=UPI00355A8D8E|nr:hypothetical protein GPJ56_001521 [Histomonas meleagridis]KAH0807027.1 hypothetical protein GO595_000203 [Histomonas meleagridis]